MNVNMSAQGLGSRAAKGAIDLTKEQVQIETRNFNFFYGQYKALRDINIDIYKHRVTAFIGPSGCGKSTFLRAFNRMYELYPEQRAEG